MRNPSLAPASALVGRRFVCTHVVPDYYNAKEIPIGQSFTFDAASPYIFNRKVWGYYVAGFEAIFSLDVICDALETGIGTSALVTLELIN